MKIVMIDHHLTMGGGQRYLIDKVLWLKQHGHDPVVVGAPRAAVVDEARLRGIRAIEVADLAPTANNESTIHRHAMRMVRAAPGVARIVRFLRRLVHVERADIVHANTAKAGALCALALAGRVPWVYHAHSSPAVSSHGWIDRLIFRRCDAIIANSPFTQSHIPAKSKVTIIPNGIRFPAPAAHARTSVLQHIMSVGRLIPHKNHESTLRALHQLRQHHVASHLTIVGQAAPDVAPDHPAELGRLIEQLGLEAYVEIVAQVEDIWQMLARADIFVSSSIGEPFGRAVVEAIWSTPVVLVSDDGAHPYLLAGLKPHEAQQLLFDPYDPYALAERLQWAITNTRDALNIMRQLRRSIRDRFDFDAVMREEVRLYERFVSEH